MIKKFLEKKAFYEIIPSRYYKNSFKNKFQGFGWTHNFGKEGSWTEGSNAFLLFKIPKLEKYYEFIFDVETFSSNTNKNFKLEILIDDQLIKTLYLNNKKIEKINFNLDKKYNNKEIMINFRLKNLVSPFEKLESPDARK